MVQVQPVRSRLRAWGLGVALAAAAPLLLGACGKSAKSTAVAGASSVITTTVTKTSTVTTSTASTSSSTTSGRSPHASSPSKEKALAYAKAVNLQASDLPGYTAKAKEHESKSTAEKQATAQLFKCLGAGVDLGSAKNTGSTLAEAESPEFTRQVGQAQHEMIQSFVTVATSPTVPATIDRVFKATGAKSCLSSFFIAALRSAKFPKQVREGPQEVSEIAAPADAFGWRLLAALRYRGVELPLELDLLGFSSGRAFVLVSAVSLLGRFDPQVERHAVSVLMARAKSQQP